MTYQANVYRVMLASPSDVKEERAEFPRILDTWNALHSAHEKAVILPVKWETHSTPEMGDRPQAIINKQLVNESDILVGVFWTKLGTPTGTAASGSVEEVEEFHSQGKPILLYFSNAPVVADSINIEQYKLLKDYRDKCFAEGLVATYDSVGEFRDLLLRHLLETVRRLRGKGQRSEALDVVNAITEGSDSIILSGETSSQDKPEIRVDIERSIVREYYDLEEYKLRVNLNNEGTTTISNYRLDIEFPKAFLNPSTIYALEKTERSTEKYKFFRVTQEHHRNDPLYPGDSRTVFIADYFTNEEISKSGALNERLKITVYINNREAKIINMPMRDLMDAKGWERKSY
jgi:hypothetical protein